MYMYNLSPILTPLVSTANPADLTAAIERARVVETGYNYIPSKEVTIPVPSAVRENPKEAPKAITSISNQEVDELSKKIEQLSLNYASLVSALTVQPAQTTTVQQRRPRTPRPLHQATSNITCFNCGKPGHMIRDCPSPRTN